jgi:hypothetical protein
MRTKRVLICLGSVLRAAPAALDADRENEIRRILEDRALFAFIGSPDDHVVTGCSCSAYSVTCEFLLARNCCPIAGTHDPQLRQPTFGHVCAR